ncbi:hypothetical protein ElyMa_005513400 [Elysia marginata]|uniref:UPAR/Ly6 domain-containing protein n=1 Tax=Elysia marginata TaxID=1093978 RepID=A0AAV4EU67_9GAST|nr:hypothetical protein ElyMa_005513400 [Elysia marginata]
MCYYCGFQANVGPECINDPKSWKNGDPHVKCKFDCVINAIFSAETGKPTFVYRSCQTGADRENGCEKVGNTHTCFFSCNGKDYCNDRDLSHSPMQDHDSTSRLTPLSSSGLLLNVGSLCTALWIKHVVERMYG